MVLENMVESVSLVDKYSQAFNILTTEMFSMDTLYFVGIGMAFFGAATGVCEYGVRKGWWKDNSPNIEYLKND